MSENIYLLVVCALVSGCAMPGPEECLGGAGSDCAPDLSDISSVPRRAQGYSTQGYSTQGYSTQGYSTQGTYAGAYSVIGATIDGVAVVDLELNGTTLLGAVGGQPKSGLDFVGATVIQVSPSGDTAEAHIDAIETDPGDASGETLLYTLSIDDGAGGTTTMCRPDAYGVAKAIPVLGRWDDTGAHHDGGFTFGCTSGVIAKCVRWGYRPWQSVGGVSLGSYHHACTRMARADYCGDGTSHTHDGTPIEYYDNLSVNVNTGSPASILFDGAWSQDGAYCIGTERWLKLTDIGNVLRLAPACKNRFSLTLLTTSPVSGADMCLVKRSDVPRSAVLMDNRTGLNVSL